MRGNTGSIPPASHFLKCAQPAIFSISALAIGGFPVKQGGGWCLFFISIQEVEARVLRFRQWLLNLVPPPRKPVTVGAALPLLIFLLVFIGGCVSVSLARLVVFSNLAPFGLLALSVWVWWLHVAGYSGLNRTRATIALLVRLCVLGVFVLALAEPRVVRRSNGLALMYALDVSDSMGETVSDQALKFILNTANGKPGKGRGGPGSVRTRCRRGTAAPGEFPV